VGGNGRKKKGRALRNGGTIPQAGRKNYEKNQARAGDSTLGVVDAEKKKARDVEKFQGQAYETKRGVTRVL